MRELPLVPQALDFTCGAACLASIFQFFGRLDANELELAEELGTLQAGYTPPENVVSVAEKHGFKVDSRLGIGIEDLKTAFSKAGVVIVTWWDEDAGHYSLIENLDDSTITLMDPWLAREGQLNKLRLEDFVPHWQARGSRAIRVFKTSP